jgi:chromosomal replication initiation ATPase DnaA
MKLCQFRIDESDLIQIRARGKIGDFIRDAIKEKLNLQQDRNVCKMIEIIEMVYNCPTGWQISRSRRTNYKVPRQLALYILQSKLGWSQSNSGAYFGMDHCTARHAKKLCELSQVTKDPQLFPYVFKIDRIYDNMGIL